jgi:hypothetical protein
MKADLSRDTFDPTRHFLRVLMQQGRVQVDADPNEQTAILLHYLQALAADLIGPAGGPKTGPNTPLGFSVELDGTDLRIWPGHYYVDGILCELEPAPDENREGARNDGTISYFEQPDYPLSPDHDRLREKNFLAYLDVWERHLTALDDEHIREVALGGPDTATRSKVVWQVKVVPVTVRTKEDALERVWPGLVEKWQPPDRGALAAGTDDPVDETDPCITPPASGYRGAENQLYRVEIVDSSTTEAPATFVWSRENGSVLSRWDQSEDELVLADPGRDHKLGFEAGQWIQLTDDDHELAGKPGTFAELTKVEHGVLTIDSSNATGPTDAASFKVKPKIRRWDSGAPRPVEVPAATEGWIPLEDGVQIKFSETGHYRSGDYWLIPARVQGGVDWPNVEGEPVLLPPHGIEHHFAPLALFVPGAAPIPLQRSWSFMAT